MSEGWRPPADIHRDVIDRALRDADKFILRHRWQLKMKASHCAESPGQGVVVLNEIGADSGGGFKVRAAIGLAEEPSWIFPPLGRDKQNLRKGQPRHAHMKRASPSPTVGPSQ